MILGRTSRLVLRTIEPTDREEIISMYVAGERMDRWGPPMDPSLSYGEMFDRWLNADARRYVRMVAERLDPGVRPRLASLIFFNDIIRSVFQNAFAAWRTHPDLLGCGYCSEAMRPALDYAFAEGGLKLHRVQASILPDNLASCRVAEKSGFRSEGIALRYLHIRGAWRDHLVYALTLDEWSSGATFPATA